MLTFKISYIGLQNSLRLPTSGFSTKSCDLSTKILLHISSSSIAKIFLRNINFLTCTTRSRLIHPSGVYALWFGDFLGKRWYLLKTYLWHFLSASTSSLLKSHTSHPYVTKGTMIHYDLMTLWENAGIYSHRTSGIF